MLEIGCCFLKTFKTRETLNIADKAFKLILNSYSRCWTLVSKIRELQHLTVQLIIPLKNKHQIFIHVLRLFHLFYFLLIFSLLVLFEASCLFFEDQVFWNTFKVVSEVLELGLTLVSPKSFYFFLGIQFNKFCEFLLFYDLWVVSKFNICLDAISLLELDQFTLALLIILELVMDKSHLFYVFWWFFSTWLIRTLKTRAKSWLHRCGELFAIASFTFKGWATSELFCKSSFKLRFFQFRAYFLKQNIIILWLLALLFIFWLVSIHEIWDVGMHLPISAKLTATLLL